MGTRAETLLVVSHVIHYEHWGKLYAFGPYTREIDIWADLFPKVVIASPLRRAPPPGDAVAFTRPNIIIAPQLETGGTNMSAKLQQVALLPVLITRVGRAMREADVIHIRCPGNLGLIGCALAPLFGRRIVAKYAGQWNGFPHEGLANRLQRFLLRSSWWKGGLVTVYGEWPNQPPQIIPFFTSMMTAEQVKRAAHVAVMKRMIPPVQILYTGRLAASKRVDLLIAAARQLVDARYHFRLHILGDGPEGPRLKRQAKELGLTNHVRFIAAVPYNDVMAWYERSHVLVLPSQHSEGWPKVIAEAMCHGLVCIGTDHGLVPQMLDGRGLIFHVGDLKGLVGALKTLLDDASLYQRLSRTGAAWARQRSIEDLQRALRTLFLERWGLDMPELATDENCHR